MVPKNEPSLQKPSDFKGTQINTHEMNLWERRPRGCLQRQLSLQPQHRSARQLSAHIPAPELPPRGAAVLLLLVIRAEGTSRKGPLMLEAAQRLHPCGALPVMLETLCRLRISQISPSTPGCGQSHVFWGAAAGSFPGHG